ncbi:hypothetical protein D3C75_1195280 [compost metagenome]
MFGEHPFLRQAEGEYGRLRVTAARWYSIDVERRAGDHLWNHHLLAALALNFAHGVNLLDLAHA